MKKDTFLYSYKFFIASQMITVAFAVYNACLGFIYTYAFGISIAIYYVLLALIRLLIILFEHKHYKDESPETEKKRHHFNLFVFIFLFLIDLSLLVPVSLLALHDKDFSFGEIPAIAMAAYTTYKVVMAIVNYKRSRKSDNMSVRMLRIIAMIDMCVSVLSLQNTLIVVFGGSGDLSMTYLVCASSLAILIFIIVFSCLAYKNARKASKEEEN